MDILFAKLLHKSGVMDQRPDWHQTVAVYTTLWLMFIPFIYAAFGEMARGSKSPILLTITRGTGGVLLVTCLALLALLTYG